MTNKRLLSRPSVNESNMSFYSEARRLAVHSSVMRIYNKTLLVTHLNTQLASFSFDQDTKMKLWTSRLQQLYPYYSGVEIEGVAAFVLTEFSRS